MNHLNYQQKYTRIFFRFLKDNNVYGAFIKRFHRHFMREKDYFDTHHPTTFLIGAFTWDSKINWGDLHHKWFYKCV